MGGCEGARSVFLTPGGVDNVLFPVPPNYREVNLVIVGAENFFKSKMFEVQGCA